MVFIYVLQLKEEKWYIGKTESSKFRIDTHFDSKGSGFTKKYPPEEIYQIIPECDKYDEDKYVKKYMDKYGIDNVRGGSYSRLELTEEEKKSIQKELWGANDLCFLCGGDHFVKDCPNVVTDVEEKETEEFVLEEEERIKYIRYYEDKLFELMIGCWSCYDSNHKQTSILPRKIFKDHNYHFNTCKELEKYDITDYKYRMDSKNVGSFPSCIYSEMGSSTQLKVYVTLKNNDIYFYRFNRGKYHLFHFDKKIIDELEDEKKYLESKLFMLKSQTNEPYFKVSNKLSSILSKGKTEIENNYTRILNKIDEIINNIPEHIISESIDSNLLEYLYRNRLSRNGICAACGQKNNIIKIDSIIFEFKQNKGISFPFSVDMYGRCENIIVNYLTLNKNPGASCHKYQIISSKSLFDIDLHIKPNESKIICNKLNEYGLYTYKLIDDIKYLHFAFAIILEE